MQGALAATQQIRQGRWPGPAGTRAARVRPRLQLGGAPVVGVWDVEVLAQQRRWPPLLAAPDRQARLRLLLPSRCRRTQREAAARGRPLLCKVGWPCEVGFGDHLGCWRRPCCGARRRRRRAWSQARHSSGGGIWLQHVLRLGSHKAAAQQVLQALPVALCHLQQLAAQVLLRLRARAARRLPSRPAGTSSRGQLLLPTQGASLVCRQRRRALPNGSLAAALLGLDHAAQRVHLHPEKEKKR